MRSATAVVLMLVLTIFAIPPAHAEETLIIRVNHGKLLMFKNVDRVVVAAPDVLDVSVISRHELMLIAKRVGETTLNVWDGQTATAYRVMVVSATVSDVTQSLKEALGPVNIKVKIVGDTVFLKGTVKTDADKARAESVASAYGKKVVNLLTLEQPLVPPPSPAESMEAQLRDALKDFPVTIKATAGDTVRIEGIVATQYDLKKIDTIAKSYAKNVVLLVRVRTPVRIQITTIIAEINRRALNQLGVEWGGGDPINLLTNPFVFNFGYLTEMNISLQTLVARLTLLESRNAAKTLANPRLVVSEGQTSRLLVGGEVPIPTVSTNGQVNITYKEFGVRLEFKPVMQPDEPITLDLLTEVSRLDFTQSIVASGFNIPTIVTRRVQTVVSMRPGEFLVIGGLIQRDDTQVITKIPLLGDIPILGALFRSTSFNKGETELVIFVSPSLVTPVTTEPRVPERPNPETLNP